MGREILPYDWFPVLHKLPLQRHSSVTATKPAERKITRTSGHIAAEAMRLPRVLPQQERQQSLL